MKLQVPFIQLPLHFDAHVLAEEISILGEEAWMPHPQGFAGNSMLPLVAVDGDPANESFSGPMLPTPALKRCSYLNQVLASLGCTVGRSRLMRLSGHAEVRLHADQGYYWAERARVHVPIVTQSTVRFECGDAAIHMAAGECWIFDTWRLHRVVNDAVEARTHLVVDTIGGSRFWELVSAGRTQAADSTRETWRSELVAPASDAPAQFSCESVNVPKVMSPWELEAHLGFLFSEVVPHPAVAPLQRQAAGMLRAWRGLWFQYGDSQPEGRSHFRELFQLFSRQARASAPTVMLANGMRWVDVLDVMIGKVAVADTTANKSGPDAQRAIGDNA